MGLRVRSVAQAFVIVMVAAASSTGPRCVAGQSLTDAQAAKRVDKARGWLRIGRFDSAASVLESLLRIRPDDVAALVLLCQTRTVQANSLALQPGDSTVNRTRFESASIACERAAAVESLPAVAARRAWAHDAELAQRDADLLPAFQAWAAAEPADPSAVGGLAALLDNAGRADDADAILARAVATSMAFGQRVRFAFACRLRNGNADRLRPILHELMEAESTPQGKAMVEVLQVLAERGAKESSLAFLERIESGALDDAAAHQLWTCVGGDARFLTPTPSEFTPAPCETVPKRKSAHRVEFPDAERRRHRQGKAIVFARINVDGTVAPIWVAVASTPEFGAAAAESVGRSVYFPATCSGVPIPYPMVQYTEFTLK